MRKGIPSREDERGEMKRLDGMLRQRAWSGGPKRERGQEKEK